MMRTILAAAFVAGSVIPPLYAETKEAEIKLRDLDLSGRSVSGEQLTLTASFDVKEARIYDEVVFDFYLLLTPRDADVKPQLFHCRTVHRYLNRKSGYKSGVVLDAAAVDGINPREEKYAVVATYKGKEVAVENSEKDRWWEDAALGDPVENMLRRVADVPIVREWESVRQD
jgi:hypothetical protein